MHYLSEITLGSRLPEYHTSSLPKATDCFSFLKMEECSVGLFSRHKGGMMADQPLLRTITV